MKLRVPDYYEKFKCIDKDCEDTCCAGWEVDLDEEAYSYYETVTGDFGDRLKSVMSKEGGLHFELKPNKDCPFLNEHKLCDLYIALGEDKLCNTCAMFPRYVEEYGSEREMGIAFSCKTAAKLILTYEGKAGFKVSEDNKPLTSYNDINPEFYFGLKKARQVAYEIAQNSDFTVWERLAILMEYSLRIQKSLNGHRYSRIFVHATDFSDVDNLKKIVKKYKNKYSNAEGNKLKFDSMSKMLFGFCEMETVKQAFPEFVKKDIELYNRNNPSDEDVLKYISDLTEFEKFYSDKLYEFEHIMVYYIFRYFLKAVYDNDLLEKMKLLVIGVLMVREMDLIFYLENKKLDLKDQIEITHLYSREVEHSDENFKNVPNIIGF